ncbi:GTPase Der [Durusdinium trenchii]|uniref:GTPase Der n=1 Tax=Durusdinium trenchii TaxID=1381693 RepID=A0ABP0HB10_9DINO
MVNKLNVELTVGKKLKPMDQHGVLLGDEYIRKWPNWLPKDWRIAYFRSAGGAPKPCFLSPRGAHYKDKKAVLAQKAKERKERSLSCKKWSARCTSKTWHPFEDDPTEELGKQDRSKMASKHSKILAELRRSKECFRTFTPQELFECFAPPLGDSLTPPSHWQGGLKVSRLPRISWLPPRWTQAYRDGSRRKLYVAPPELGAKVVFHRENVEVLEGGKRFTDRQQVLSHLNPNSQPKKPAVCRVKLGDFARRHAFLIRQRHGEFGKQICSLRTSLPFVPADDSEDEFPETCDVFRSFTYQEFKDCFAPPLGDCTVPPSHWPEGLQVCTLPRISWLPPGWGQGIRMGQKGRRLKVFVAPEGHGRLVVNNKQSMEVILQTRLRPLDQYGKVLGLGDECVEHWPKWLPRTWRIAYFKEDGNVKVCYISPAGDKCLEKAAVMSKAREQRVVEKANEAEAERMRKRRRLRKMNSEALCLDEQQDQQDAENENEEVAEQAAEKAAAEAHAEAEAAEAGSEGSINSGGFCHGFSVKSRCAVVNPLVL